jgi:hypothetical protein
LTVVDGRPAGLKSGNGPRIGNVRDGTLLHFFESSDFDEDILLVFRQLVGLPDRGRINGKHFLPLIGLLAPRLTLAVPECHE